MPMNSNYEPTDLKVVHNDCTDEWFVFDINEGDVVSDPFATAAQAEAEMAYWLK